MTKMTKEAQLIQPVACVQEIVNRDLEIGALIQDIRCNCSCVDDLNEVNFKIKEQMKILQTRIEDLERIANEQDKDTDRQNILKDAENYRKQFLSTKTAVRKANLSCKLSIDKNERNELLKGGADAEVRKRTNKESLAKTASSITENLMSMNRMMASSVKQSELTNQTLVKSSTTLQETQEEFKGMGGVIQTSRSLLTKYSRRELTDRILIFIAIALFLATVLYILKKRIF